MAFTASQRKAIEHGGENLQLIACAGSGKTEVVARRVVHLLSPDSQPVLAPRNIVAFTFTEKAAAELKERIVTRCHSGRAAAAPMRVMNARRFTGQCFLCVRPKDSTALLRCGISMRHMSVWVMNCRAVMYEARPALPQKAATPTVRYRGSYGPIVLQKSKVAGLRIFAKNPKREAIADV